jgi:hypothetical protein
MWLAAYTEAGYQSMISVAHVNRRWNFIDLREYVASCCSYCLAESGEARELLEEVFAVAVIEG